MNRKTLAVCISGYDTENESKILKEILTNCKENNINVLVFASLMMKGDFPSGINFDSNIVRGESEIFNLINYDMIDGLVIFGNSIYSEDAVSAIVRNCENHNIPIVNVNDPERKLKHNVTIQNTYAMELIMEHLVKHHKLTRINFIGGYPDNKESIERLTAYKKILKKYKIPVEEKRIAYGYFWKQSVECAKKFLKNDVPQAIVCANDTMAILVCDYLKSQGYKIPQDIVVTGFDGISDVDTYEPSITTVRPNYAQAGKEVFNLMYKLLNGEQDSEDMCVGSELVVHNSCGCKIHKKQLFNYIDTKYTMHDGIKEFNKQMVRADIHFSDEISVDELLEHITTSLDLFAFVKFFYCLDEKLESNSEYFFRGGKSKYGMPSKVIEVVPYNIKFSEKLIVPTKKILGYDFLTEEKPCLLYFSPLYYRDRVLGYIGYEPSNSETNYSDLFQLWVFSAAEKIGGFYLKRELEKLNATDHLTGLANRRGMEEYMSRLYDSAVAKGEYISVVCIDIDYLKQINDKYGHESGDNAIVQTASAIEKTFSKNSICVRTGGDEFTVITHSEKKPDIDKMIKKITDILEKYNQKNLLPYEIMCSCGYFTLSGKDFTSFEDMQKAADAQLYQVKAMHHTR